MKVFLTIIKWIAIVLFFPLSLLVVAYFKQKKSNRAYYESGDV